MVARATLVRQRTEMEAQRALGQRILAEMKAPAAPVPTRVAEAAARFAGWAGGADEAESHYHTPRRSYRGSDLTQIEDDLDTGCQLWTGRYSAGNMEIEYPAVSGTHALCGRRHWQVARALVEEALGRPLDDQEWVVGTCEANADPRKRPCVAPGHHKVAPMGTNR